MDNRTGKVEKVAFTDGHGVGSALGVEIIGTRPALTWEGVSGSGIRQRRGYQSLQAVRDRGVHDHVSMSGRSEGGSNSADDGRRMHVCSKNGEEGK